MNTLQPQHLLQVMINYFETGNRETDQVAKSILESDSAYQDHWRDEIIRFKKSDNWTGLRAPEAEIMAGLLHRTLLLLEKDGMMNAEL